uniref:Uncharacterized protein n=1 Tax=Oryza rufipogon TaxID=4529 RepID=A0A0E0QWT0_ORYRU
MLTDAAAAVSSKAAAVLAELAIPIAKHHHWRRQPQSASKKMMIDYEISSPVVELESPVKTSSRRREASQLRRDARHPLTAAVLPFNAPDVELAAGFRPYDVILFSGEPRSSTC